MGTDLILNAIGSAQPQKQGLAVQIDKEVIPALRHLRHFSHATFLFGDGTGAFCVRVAKLRSVDEKSGLLLLEAACGLLAGNAVYDIKPYMPCEDNILQSNAPASAIPDAATAEGGAAQMALCQNGVIRREKGRYFLCPDDFAALAGAATGCSHIKVLWWFSRFDKPQYRRAMQGNPPYENAPRSGVFATRSPVRPNPIALTVAKVLGVDAKRERIEVSALDCFDGTPLVGLRPYLPQADAVPEAAVPEWLAHWPRAKETGAPAENGGAAPQPEDILQRYLGAVQATDVEGFFADAAEAPAAAGHIVVRGARQNNLQNVNVEIPKGKITAIAGVSGSGKSSLAFDTLYAESRRRFAEGADAPEAPDVDSIAGLPPAIAIAQRAVGRNPRATVGTFTGLQGRLRLLYAAVGLRHCPACGHPVQPRSREELAHILHSLAGHALTIQPQGSGESLPVPPASTARECEQLVEEALHTGKGAFTLTIDGTDTVLLQNRQMCYHCGHILFEMSPALFSANNPESMCPTCNGLGTTADIDPALVVARPHFSVLDGASDYWGDMRTFQKNPTANWMRGELLALAESRGVDLARPWRDLPETFRHAALYGSGGEKVSWRYVHPKNGRSGTITRPVAGAVPTLQRLMQKGGGTAERTAAQFVQPVPCPACKGERLSEEGRMATVAGLRFPQAAALPVEKLAAWVYALPGTLPAQAAQTAKPLLHYMAQKARQLQQAGLGHLALDRALPTLSGGELQRLKLVAQMGQGLSGLLYVMDEPTAGLHPRDYGFLQTALHTLKEEGNTVVLVEHEEALLCAADHLIEIGPGAGQNGGHLVWQGTPRHMRESGTQTGQYLYGQKQVCIKRPALPPKTEWVRITGARGNNLKGVDVTFPKARITCITGVSGSGKSTLASAAIAPAVEAIAAKKPVGGCCERVRGADDFTAVVYASQSPIGRSSRSNIATYLGLMDEVRRLFAATPDAARQNLTAAAFSFNNPEGRCDACKGEGHQTIPVPFAADIHTPCPACGGRRYRKSVLGVRCHGKNIHEVLQTPVAGAAPFFESNKAAGAIVDVLQQVGLGYLTLGQSTGSLSGGEAQRLKLAKALLKKQSGKLLYILDEPTAGLHFSDTQNLLELLSRLAAAGHTVLAIEHNRHIIQNADWLIDLGPEGGDAGGQVMAQGTPAMLRKSTQGHTGAALRLWATPNPPTGDVQSSEKA